MPGASPENYENTNSMKDYAKLLERKGKLTIVEVSGGKTTVAIQTSGSILTLQGDSNKDKLMAELYAICRNWSDIV